MNKKTKYEKAKQIVKEHERTLERQQIIDSLKDGEMYIVRLYDRFDGYWIDVNKPALKQETIAIWDKYTKNGMESSQYEDGDYYSIFPENSRMIFS